VLWCGGTHTPAHATNAKGCKNPIQGRPADQPASTRATQPPSHPATHLIMTAWSRSAGWVAQLGLE
jgi:hypothetical protein